MSRKGAWMISLVALSGVSAAGCWRSATLPPSSAIPNTPAIAPPYRVPPAARPPMSPSPLPRYQPPPGLAIKRWQPDVAPRDWKWIVIHHTASSRGSVESIHQAHLRRKDSRGNPWLGIGYHFVIGNGDGMGDGEIEPTFRWRAQLHGAHAGSRVYNQSGIGISLVGNFEKYPPSSAQLAAVKRLVAVLKAEYGIPSENVIGHRKIKATACPGKYFPLAEVSQSLADDVLVGAGPRHSNSLRLVGF